MASNLGLKVEMQQHIPLHKWVANNISYLNTKEWTYLKDNIEFIVILWEIWKHPNEISFRKENVTQIGFFTK